MKKAVVILGMFRSGTSMTAGILDRLNVNIGDNMLQESRANPLGYYEDLDFMDINRKILEEAGGDLNNPPPLKDIISQKSNFEEGIREIVERKSKGIWGWKDPVNSLTIHLFIQHLNNPHIIICRRDLDDICLSYSKMIDKNRDQVKKLAEFYYGSIQHFLDKNKRSNKLELKYEEVLDEPEESIESIIKFLDIEPSEREMEKAIELVKPRYKMKLLRLKRMVKSGIKNPLKVPNYLYKRAKYVIEEMF